MLSHTRRKNSLNSQSAFRTYSAVCFLNFVSGLQSAFCTNRCLWHQYFGYSYSHNTHNLPQNTCVWVNLTFSFFSALVLFFPFVRMKTSLTMFQVIHSMPMFNKGVVVQLISNHTWWQRWDNPWNARHCSSITPRNLRVAFWSTRKWN